MKNGLTGNISHKFIVLLFTLTSIPHAQSDSTDELNCEQRNAHHAFIFQKFIYDAVNNGVLLLSQSRCKVVKIVKVN